MNTSAVLPHQKLVVGNNGGQIPFYAGAYRGAGKVILTAKSDAGSSPTLDVKLQNAAERLRIPEALGAGDDALAHRTATDVAIRLGAAFTLATGTTIAAVYLPLKKNGTVSSGTLTLALQADTAGEPSGTDLVTATSAAADVSSDGSNVEFRFAVPRDLAAGDYWLVLTSNVTLHAANNIEWRSTSVESGGNAAQFDEAWGAAATHNLEHWCESYQFADITGGAYTTATTTASLQTIELNMDALGYIRPHVTIGGTSTPAFYAGVALLGNLD
jgi:hypothetical protein